MLYSQVRVSVWLAVCLLSSCSDDAKVKKMIPGPAAEANPQVPSAGNTASSLPPPGTSTISSSSSLPATGVCQAGYFCPAGSPLPYGAGLCPMGVFCPQGTTTANGAGPCKEGYHCPAGSKEETGGGKCPAGYFCPKGTKDGKENPSGPGFYAEEVLAAAKPCGKGNFCPGLINLSATKCTNTAMNGQFLNDMESNATCQLLCNSGFTLSGGECLATSSTGGGNCTASPSQYLNPGSSTLRWALTNCAGNRTITLKALTDCARTIYATNPGVSSGAPLSGHQHRNGDFIEDSWRVNVPSNYDEFFISFNNTGSRSCREEVSVQ